MSQGKAARVQQVRYRTWGTEPPGSSYFEDIDLIAQWIGWGLEAQSTGWRVTPHQMSTIAVQQSKEKWGEVRVYCSLAASNRVTAAWRRHLADWRKESGKEGDLSPRPKRADFEQECLRRDREWYRQVYSSAVRSWPHYREAILTSADYRQLLLEPDEAQEWIDLGHISPEDIDIVLALSRRSL